MSVPIASVLALTPQMPGRMQEDGLRNTEWVKEQKKRWPALAPLLLLLKQFLYNRDLHETYTGGMGSYLLTMTIISHLQHHPGCGPDHLAAEANLGALLVDYLHLYGLRFNMEEIGISVREGGQFFSKKRQGWEDKGRPFLLSVEDPNNEESDIGKNSYNIRNVQRAFEHAFYSLVVRDATQTPLGRYEQGAREGN
jgi:non-canonical poly(A) RNA polymerase PAPD5/7